MTNEEFFLNNAIFTTKDFALATDVRLDSAARSLKAHVRSGLLTKITRGVWANVRHQNFSLYGLIPYILEKEQGYLSFLSALHRHGVISQIPQKIFIATTGHTRRLISPLMEFNFIQMNPKYMCDGIEWFSAGTHYGFASVEKALLDCLYISTRRGRRFSNFPELDFENINKKKFVALLKRQGYPVQIESKIKERFKELQACAL